MFSPECADGNELDVALQHTADKPPAPHAAWEARLESLFLRFPAMLPNPDTMRVTDAALSYIERQVGC